MTTSTLAGKSVVLTGKLDQLGMLREEAIRALNQRGAYVQDAVDEGTDFLVQGRPPGRETVKARRARALGIPVIDQRDFAELLARADKIEARQPAKAAAVAVVTAGPDKGRRLPVAITQKRIDRPEAVERAERRVAGRDDAGLGDILADLAARERRDEREW